MESRFDDADNEANEDVHRPDVSVVHVAQEDMDHRQALHWESTISTREGRMAAIEWLLNNDPVIAGLYANIRQLEVDADQVDLAAVLILVKAMRSKVQVKKDDK